ncbi:MAG: 30S ribosome-binding factor RbfA [Acidobacteriota bacterium]
MRTGEVVQHELMRLIQREMHDPRLGFVTVTEVRMSPDLRSARVYVSVMGEEEKQKETLSVLQHAEGFLRNGLSKVLQMRFTPELHFVLDRSIERSIRIEELLHEDEKQVVENHEDEKHEDEKKEE